MDDEVSISNWQRQNAENPSIGWTVGKNSCKKCNCCKVKDDKNNVSFYWVARFVGKMHFQYSFLIRMQNCEGIWGKTWIFMNNEHIFHFEFHYSFRLFGKNFTLDTNLLILSCRTLHRCEWAQIYICDTIVFVLDSTVGLHALWSFKWNFYIQIKHIK